MMKNLIEIKIKVILFKNIHLKRYFIILYLTLLLESPRNRSKNSSISSSSSSSSGSDRGAGKKGKKEPKK